MVCSEGRGHRFESCRARQTRKGVFRSHGLLWNPNRCVTHSALFSKPSGEESGMTKAEHARIVAWRLRILQHAAVEPRYVAQACRYFGISRTAFYRWKKRFDELGEAGLGGWKAVRCRRCTLRRLIQREFRRLPLRRPHSMSLGVIARHGRRIGYQPLMPT